MLSRPDRPPHYPRSRRCASWARAASNRRRGSTACDNDNAAADEVAFLALSEVAPVTHAVTNTVKRVVIILASVIVFKNPVTPLGIAGSAMAILGATAYSIAKSKCK